MIRDRRVDRLHARRTVAHDRPARDLVAAAHAQRDDAPDVHFVGRGRGATEDHLVELGGLERLAQQQRAAGVGREIRRRERPGSVARLEERRARAVDDVDGLHALRDRDAGQRNPLVGDRAPLRQVRRRGRRDRGPAEACAILLEQRRAEVLREIVDADDARDQLALGAEQRALRQA